MTSVATHPSAISGATGAGGSRMASAGLDLTHGVVLYLDGISVSFDGFKALNILSLSIYAAELRCVLGPNGAGKTTTSDGITVKTRPDSGGAVLCMNMHVTPLPA